MNFNPLIYIVSKKNKTMHFILFSIFATCLIVLLKNLPERGRLTGFDKIRFQRLIEKLDRRNNI